MTLGRPLLAAVWLLLALVPFAWWLATRRAVNTWQSLPVPAALLDRHGNITSRTGPHDADFTMAGGLPPAGRIARTRTAGGTPLAVTGLRGGALAVALPDDPVGERRDRVLAELGARLAHDINTPLGALHGHLDLIGHEPISDAARDSVAICQRELLRLQTTAQDLLTFTRLRAGGGARSTQLAGALAEEAAAALIDRADALNAALTVEVPSERVAVHVAEADLVRALRNLIGNALAYGLGQDREVLVAVDASSDTVTFTVADSGPGLDETELETLSQPLVRGADTATTGSGLGLAIVAEVLAGHGTRLETSRDVDRSRLHFTLPRTA